MRPITLMLIATAAIGLSLFCCKKSPEPCWDSCQFPRKCFTYSCECSSEGMFFYADANMCLILLCQMRKMFYISVFKNDEATHK